MDKIIPLKIIDHSNENCCGCGACAQVCHRSCIEMVKDMEGFLYPKVSLENCVGCLKCENVCPCVEEQSPRLPISDYAIINPCDEVRSQSSSGGIFYEIAKSFVEKDGVVFGARFDENQKVCHDVSVDLCGLHNFQGSKYVQSEIGSTFIQVREFLKSGKYVLFSGTPCQVAGLKKFLHKDYEKLLTVDCICHGVPSPLVFEKYLNEIIGKSNNIKVIFRDKSEGWYGYHVKIQLPNDVILYDQKWTNDPYMQLFVSDYSLRPSCYNCPAKSGKSGSDITLGDFWGVDQVMPHMYDNKGTSLVLANTQKGKYLLDNIEGLNIEMVSHDLAISFNSAWSNSADKPLERDKFFKLIRKKKLNTLYVRFLHPEMLLKNRLKSKISRVLHFVNASFAGKKVTG